jgi:hypothetical protein
MRYGVRVHRAAGALFQHVVENFQGTLRGLLPTEVGGTLQSQPLCARAQFAIQQQIRQGANDFVQRIRVEQDGGAVDDLRES